MVHDVFAQSTDQPSWYCVAISSSNLAGATPAARQGINGRIASCKTGAATNQSFDP